MAFHTTALFLACAVFSSYSTTADILKLRFTYDPEKDDFPRVRFQTSFTSLSSFTLCLWAKPNFVASNTALLSYGVPGQDKEIYLALGGGPILYVGGTLFLDQTCDGQRPVYWISGAWHHICVTWSTSQSFIRAYVNGVFCSKSSTEHFTHRVPGNGVMVLGQALKGLDTDFHKNLSWSGDIAGVQMWDEVLSYKQIVDIGKCRGKMEGNVVAWMKTPMVASDKVMLFATDVCDVLSSADN